MDWESVFVLAVIVVAAGFYFYRKKATKSLPSSPRQPRSSKPQEPSVSQKPAESPKPAAPRKPSTPTKPVKPLVQDFITAFALPQKQAPLFHGTPGEIEAQVKSVGEMAELKSFLMTSSNEEAGNFHAMLERYEKRLNKMRNAFDVDDYDEEELAGAATEKLFKVLNTLLPVLLPAIYRGHKQAAKAAFYEGMAEHLGHDLAALHLYTRLLQPGQKMSDRDYDDMKVTFQDTDDVTQDKVIDEVETLPYYMDYVTEDGDTESRILEGNMFVKRFKKE